MMLILMTANEKILTTIFCKKMQKFCWLKMGNYNCLYQKRFFFLQISVKKVLQTVRKVFIFLLGYIKKKKKTGCQQKFHTCMEFNLKRASFQHLKYKATFYTFIIFNLRCFHIWTVLNFFQYLTTNFLTPRVIIDFVIKKMSNKNKNK